MPAQTTGLPTALQTGDCAADCAAGAGLPTELAQLLHISALDVPQVRSPQHPAPWTMARAFQQASATGRGPRRRLRGSRRDRARERRLAARERPLGPSGQRRDRPHGRHVGSHAGLRRAATSWPSPSSTNSASTSRWREVSPHLIRAIIAVEDQRFYTHHGFDLIRIASAASTNVRRGRAAQGGSTITQQLARQSFLTPDKTIRRKLQELILAERIEVLYQKAADPRAVPEQGLFRRRSVRRRSGVARLLRQARLGVVAVRRPRCSPAW